MPAAKHTPYRPIPPLQAVLPLVIVISLLLPSALIWRIPFFWSLLTGWVTALVLARHWGFELSELITASWQGIRSTLLVVTAMALIGALIAAWLSSGTVAAFIYYGLQVTDPRFLVFSAFLLAACVSLFLGTAIGTLSTLGVAMMGLGQTTGVPSAVLAGALVSGAFVGDRSSPVSSIFHLVAAMTGVQPERQLTVLVKTALPAVLLSGLAYAWFGLGSEPDTVSPDTISTTAETLRNAYQINAWALLPAALLLTLAGARTSLRLSLLGGILSGTATAVYLQQLNLGHVLQALLLGYQPKQAIEGLAQVLQGGGIASMLPIILLLLTAGAFNGVLVHTEVLHLLMGRLLQRARGRLAITASTMALSLAAGVVSCNQMLSVIIPAQLLKPVYARQKQPPELLARTLADSGVMFAGLIPWNLLAMLCSATLGVSSLEYGRYAFFLWTLPLVSLAITLAEEARLTRADACSSSAAPRR